MPSTLLPKRLLELNNKKNKVASQIDHLVFGQKMSLLAKVFGCWHSNISRPFVQGKTAYRSCLKCGARKQFNPDTLETRGGFYFAPVIKKKELDFIEI
jgi:hypothetical protein